MTGTEPPTEAEAGNLRQILSALTAGAINRALLIEIGYTLGEIESLAARLRRIGEQAFTLAGDHPRLLRLRDLWEENPTLLQALKDSTGFLLGAGSWLVTPTTCRFDRTTPPSTDSSTTCWASASS